jgi:hypothetical protein
MAGLSHLRDVYEKRGKEFLENLLNKTVIINEKNDGAYFGAKRDAKQNNLNFFKKDSKIGYIDRVLSKYYEPGIRHFENVRNNVTSIPENYVFGMDYNPAKEIPLTLSHIKVLDENYQTSKLIHNKTELDKWAGVLGVNPPSIIFQGKLNDEQKVKIQEFIFTSLPMLAEKFKTHSFSKHILSVLHPIVDENAQPNLSDREISEIVFRFFDEEDPIGDSSTLAKIIDPVFYDNAKNLPQEKFQKKSDDYVWIIVTDLMNFIESYRMSDLRSFTISGETADERFISLINHIFIEFIKEYGDKFNDLEIQIPQFLTRPEFDINPELINDPNVINILSKNPNYKEIYRIFINIFRKKKIKVNSTLFTDAMKANLIDQIDKLSKVAMGDQLFENYFPSFSEFVGDDKAPGYFETYDVAENEERKVKKVNLLVSDFQPIHKGHLKNAKLLTEKNGLPTLFVCVHPGKSGKMFPFKKETLNNSLSKLAAHDKQNIAGHVMIKDGNIETILKAIKPGFEPLSIAAEPSRIKDLALQLELAKKRSRNLNIKRDTRLIELPVTTVSELILKSIKDRDFAAFKEASPSQIHSEFYNLNKDLIESLNESVNEQITDAVTEIVSGVTFSTPEPIIQIES